jgi:hypothetical protein
MQERNCVSSGIKSLFNMEYYRYLNAVRFVEVAGLSENRIGALKNDTEIYTTLRVIIRF